MLRVESIPQLLRALREGWVAVGRSHFIKAGPSTTSQWVYNLERDGQIRRVRSVLVVIARTRGLLAEKETRPDGNIVLALAPKTSN